MKMMRNNNQLPKDINLIKTKMDLMRMKRIMVVKKEMMMKKVKMRIVK